jgi:hypothetical protein
MNDPDFREVSEVPSFVQIGRKPDGTIKAEWAGGSIMKFVAPSDAKPHYRLQRVTVTIPGKGAFEDLVKRQIEVACRTGRLGGMAPLEILVDKNSPESEALAYQLVKNLGFKVDRNSQVCYFDTKEELKRRALVEIGADRLIASGGAKLVGHAVAGDGSPCSFYVVASPKPGEGQDGESVRGTGLVDGDLFRVKVNTRDGVRTILDESTAGFRQDLHECKLMRREVEYDAMRIYNKVVEGTEIAFNPKESANLAPTLEQAVEQFNKRAGVSLTAAENVQQSSVEDKKLPPPLPQTVAEKAKVKARKGSIEKSLEKSPEKAPEQTTADNIPY